MRETKSVPLRAVERFMDCTHRFGAFYWFFVPGYIFCYILFGSKTPDPLGLYNKLIESGEFAYD